MIPGFHPLNKTAIGRGIMRLRTDIFEMEDPALLTVLLESEKAIRDQCEVQLPDLYEGLEELIETTYERIKDAP